MRYPHHCRPGIGHSRTASLADDPHRQSITQWLEILRKEAFICVLAHLKEHTIIDGEIPVDTAQETTCGTHILHHEMTNLAYNRCVVCGQHLRV